MIRSIKIDREKLRMYCPLSPSLYDFKEIELFKDSDEIVFKKGLNIIVGDNGYGKSALIDLITTLLFTNKSFKSEFNQSEISYFKRNPVYRFADMMHDGQQAYFINTSKAVGLEGGNFTDSNFKEAIENIVVNQRQSNGQGTMTLLNRLFISIVEDGSFLSDSSFIESALRFSENDGFSDDDLASIRKNYLNNITGVSQRTIIIDEFEKGLSLESELSILNALEVLADKYDYQIILASQSPLLSTLYFKMNEDGNGRKVNFIGQRSFMPKQLSIMLDISKNLIRDFEDRASI